MALRRLIELALFGAFVAVLIGVTATQARAQEPPITPDPDAPAAPTELINLGGVISWVDNSDVEDGFRLTYRLSGAAGDTDVFTYEVAANVTTFTLPADAPKQSCPEYTAQFLTLVAFNEFGDSSLDMFSTVADCGPAPTPAPAASPTSEAVVLPRAGTAFEEATSSWHSPYLQTIVVSVAVAGMVLALMVRAARRR